jgi:hypothetical protein
MQMNYGLHIIETPSGRFTFVGSVPYQLGFTGKDGQTVSDAYISNQLLLPSAYRSIKTRSFESREAAESFLTNYRNGPKPDGINPKV